MTEDLKGLADLITANIISTTKAVLTSDEAAKYMGITRSYLYKLTMNAELPFYKPMGKLVYFKREELEEWLLRYRNSTKEEIEEKAASFKFQKGGRNGNRN